MGSRIRKPSQCRVASQATYTTPQLLAGAHELYAKYNGDGSYAASTSNTVYATAADHSGPAIGTTVYSFGITTDPTTTTYRTDGTATGYAANGNIAAYTDTVMGQWSFGYDSLNRLSSGNAKTGPVPQQIGSYFCWNYDSFGNRLGQSIANQGFSISDGSSCQSSGGTTSQISADYDSSNNRIKSTNTGTPGYDDSGNIINDTKNWYLFDGEGRLCAVQAPPPVAGLPLVMEQYIYDAEGRRVAKGTITSWSCNIDSNGFVQTTAYVHGPNEEQMTEMSVAANGSMTWTHTNAYAADRLVATYQNDNGGKTPVEGNLHFGLTDWLGSKRVQAAYNGAPENSWTNLPFGENLTGTSGSDATEQHFTGKERDAESNLDYFGARYYASSMGRFMSPDPSSLTFADPTNPQSLNHYSYVLNNPLSFIDPDGLECVWDDGSYDSNDDKVTSAADEHGNHTGCSGKGGTWIDHSYFTQNNMADWSNQGNSTLAGMTVSSATVNTSSPDPFLDGVVGAPPVRNQVAGTSDPALALVSAIATQTAGFPNVCSVSFSARVQIPSTPIKAGVSVDGKGKLSASASWKQAGKSGGPSVSLTGRANGSGGAVVQQVSVPIPFSPLNFTFGANPLGGRNSYGISRDFGKIFSVGAAGTFGYMGDPTCGRQ